MITNLCQFFWQSRSAACSQFAWTLNISCRERDFWFTVLWLADLDINTGDLVLHLCFFSRGRRRTSEVVDFTGQTGGNHKKSHTELEDEGAGGGRVPSQANRLISRPCPGAGMHRRFWSSGQQVAINVGKHTHAHTHTLVASLNFGKFRPKGEFNYSSCCSPASPHWLRGLDMLIKPELIKRSLGLRVSLPLTSLTAVSVPHLRRLINKKSSFRAVEKKKNAY